jgi:hypothetical protein
MKKKIALSAGLSIITFIISLWLMFPYKPLVTGLINDVSKNAGIQISYSSLESGPFSTVINDLEVEGIPVGKTRIGYGLIRLLTMSVSLDSEGYVNLESVLSQDDSTFSLTTQAAIVNSFITDASLSGELKAEGMANMTSESGDVKASIGSITFNTPVGEMTVEDVNAEVALVKNKLAVKKLTSGGSTAVDLAGEIRLNRRNLFNSFVNLKGTVTLFGSKKKLTLKGSGLNIRSEIK